MSNRSVSWRKDAHILDRLVEVERRHLAGQPNTSIAAALGVDEITIRRDLERVRQLWRERTGASIDDLRAEAVAELDDTRRRALDACDEPNAPDDDFVDRRGKAAVLSVARQATMDKAKVLGIVIDKTALTDADGNDLATVILKARADASNDQ